jgi:hypothetical protein
MKKRRSFLRRVGSRARGDSGAKEAVNEVTPLDEINNGPHTAYRTETPQTQAKTTAADAPEKLEAEYKTPIDRDSHLTTRFVSVNKACEEIWKCQDPEQAAPRLELLHHALLRTPLDSYLPSEVFVCISGAALRFQGQESPGHNIHVLWTVWEEAMWAAAALARVCVGVAWRQQLRERQAWIHGARLEEDSTTESSTQELSPIDAVSTENMPRSFSPMTSSSFEATMRFDACYPVIPENLPAAMLRFAAIECLMPKFDEVLNPEEQQLWLDRRKSLAEAQRELVLALCYILPEEQQPDDLTVLPVKLEWSILEAHAPVASMVRFWLESASMTWAPRKEASMSITPIEKGIVGDERKGEDLEQDMARAHTSTKSVESKQSTVVSNDYSGLSTIHSGSWQYPKQDSSIREYPKQDLSVDYDPRYRIWNGALDSRKIDWWSTLQVVRAAFHLVSAGWRIPRDDTGEEIVEYFIEIVDKGMMVRADQLRSYGTGTDRDAREERLAASSSAMSAVSVLSAVASMGLIPYNAQSIIVRKMCRLQVMSANLSESLVNALFPRNNPVSPTEEVQWKADYETFLGHREDCISDISALQWVLLAHSSSAAATMATLSNMMHLAASAQKSEEETSMTIPCEIVIVRSACIAVDAVSRSLWGMPSDIPGVAKLRIYWYPVLVALRSLASSAHDRIVRLDTTWKDMESGTDGRDALLHVTLSLVLELIVALGRFANDALLRGECLLSPDEWEVVVAILDENIDKWLCIKDCTAALAAESAIIYEIRSEVGMLLVQLQHFLERCSQPEVSILNIAVEDVCRQKLYAVLLRKAAPYMSPEKGTSLALAVIRSWSATGFALHRSDDWAHTAPCIIANAFADFEDFAFGFYGGCVHSPSVRLEALKSVVGDNNELLDPENSGATLHLSPLARSIHVRDRYLAILNLSVIPLLMKMFGPRPSDRDIRVAVVVPLPMPSFSSQKQPFSMDFYGAHHHLHNDKLSLKANEISLRRFALGLVGHLYRSVTAEERHRFLLLEMLRTFAVNEAVDIVKLTLKASESTGGMETSTAFTEEFYTTFAAIEELEKCLELPFRAHAHAHESFPVVLDALCSLISVYAGEPEIENTVKNAKGLAMKRCLALAALLPLARLGSTHNKRLVLNQRYALTGFVPSSLAPLLNEGIHKGKGRQKQRRGEDSSDIVVAPDIVVSDDAQKIDLQPPRPSVGRTRLSFVPIFSCLLSTLLTNLESKQLRDEAAIDCLPVEELDSNFRAACYDALRNFVRSGITFPLSKELIPILNFSGSKKTNHFSREDLSRCRCVATVVESLVVKYEETISLSLQVGSSCQFDVDSDFLAVLDNLLRHLSLFCASTDTRSILSGCQSLHGLAGFIAGNFVASGLGVYGILLVSLQIAVTNMKDGAEVGPINNEWLSVTEALVSVLFEVGAWSGQTGNLPSNMLSQTFDACMDVCMSHHSRDSRFCRSVCVRMIALLLNTLVTEDASPSSSVSVKARLNYLLSTSALEIGDMHTDAAHDWVSQSKVLDDLITQKLLQLHDVHNDAGLIDAPCGSCRLIYHEVMAKETDDINQFIVETAVKYQEAPFAAWLCGHSTLLTCRLGSRKSRYRGWLEVIVRSPTSRIRRLIRLPSTNSLDLPELPSSSWCDPSPFKSSEMTLEEMPNTFMYDSTETIKASLLIEKFDALFYPLIADTTTSSDEVLSSSLLDQGLANRKTNSTTRCGGFSQDNGALSLGLPMDSDKNTSVSEWLRLILRDHQKVECVVTELCKLGFTHSALGFKVKEVSVDTLTNHFLPMERLSDGPNIDRAICILDRTPAFNTHKIAILFVTDSEARDTSEGLLLEEEVLSSTTGSPLFLSFVDGLGKLVLTRHLKYYSGGLDTSGSDSDGKFAVIWFDREDRFARSMVVFHVVPLMPEGMNNRKRHVGNNNVHIVYVDPSYTLDQNLFGGGPNENKAFSIVSGEFGFVIILVEMLTRPELVRVRIHLRDGLSNDIESRLHHVVGDHLVSRASAPAVVRQLATRADVACRTITEDHFGKQNWEERQSQIDAMKRYVVPI